MGDVEVRFDQEAFATAVRIVIAARGVRDGEVALEAGVSPSTITRTVRQGKRPDVDGLARLANWAQIPVELFMIRTCEPSAAGLAAALMATGAKPDTATTGGTR